MAPGLDHADDALATDWDTLASSTAAAPWARPGWFDAWAKAFGHGPVEPCAVYRDGSLVALLPLERTPRHAAAPANWHTPELIPLARDDDAAHALADAVLESRPRRLRLPFLRRPSAFLEALERRAHADGYRVLTRTYAQPPYLDLTGDWESFWTDLSGSFRGNLRRRRRALEKLGDVRVEVLDGRSDLMPALERVFALEASGWKGRNGTAVSSRPETLAFYTEIARWARDRGWLRLAFLLLDERPLATVLGLEDGRAFATLKTGYDEMFRWHAPGFELDRVLIQQSFGRGLERYEFLGTETEAKRKWTSTTRELVLVQAFAPGLRGTAEWSAYRYGRPAARRTMAFVRRVRS